MNLDLFHDDTIVPIDKFGGAFNDDDPTLIIYDELHSFSAFAYYSTASADRLLAAADKASVFVDLTRSTNERFDRPGYMEVAMANGDTLHWSLFDGPQGSALVCFILTPNGYTRDRDPLGLAPDGIFRTGPGMDIRMALIDKRTTTTGAAAAIGMGNVVAPWYVPGFERTGGSADAQTEGPDSLPLMSSELIHALASWEQVTYDSYRRTYVDGNGISHTIGVAAGLGHTSPGPKLFHPLGTMTEQELTDGWSGIERFGSCRPHLIGTLGTVLCDVDIHVTSDQLDACARNLIDTIGRWKHYHGDVSKTDNASSSVPAPSSDLDAHRLHDALKARLGMVMGQTKAGGFCTSCGAPLPPDAKFCGQCGAKVRRAGTTAGTGLR